MNKLESSSPLHSEHLSKQPLSAVLTAIVSTILDKNVKKNGLTAMSSFKIRLLKARTTTSSPPFPPKGNLEVQLDHFCSRLDTIDHWLGKGRQGAMVLSNLWDRHFVVKKVKNS